MHYLATIEVVEAIMRDREREAQRRREQAGLQQARASRRPGLPGKPVGRARPAV
jgi:hypothetical protein